MRAWRSAELRSGRRRLDRELLERIGGDQTRGAADGIEARILATATKRTRSVDRDTDVRAHTIDGEVVGALALTIDAELAEAIGCRWHWHGAGRQEDQRLKAAPIHREALDEPSIDRRAESGRQILKRYAIAYNGYRFGDGAHLQSDSHRDGVADIEHDV